MSLARGGTRLVVIFTAIFLIFLAAFLPSSQTKLVKITERVAVITQKFRPGIGVNLDSSEPLPLPLSSTSPPSSDSSSWPNYSSSSPNSAGEGKANAVIFILLPPSRIRQTIIALRNVEDRFNRRLKYPYVLFLVEGEESQISDIDRRKIDHITQSRTTWASVPKTSMWDPPLWADRQKIDEGLEKIGFGMGYHSMCRFYSVFFWKHPALEGYEWLWRLDSDIEFHCDVPYDPVQKVIDAGALYGFIQVSTDTELVQPTLAPTVSKWMKENRDLLSRFSGGLPLPPSSRAILGDNRDSLSLNLNKTERVNHEFVWYPGDSLQRAFNGEATNADWTRYCMYNNYEISHRSIWESELYTNFSDYLENEGGFFYERWSDSPIHSFGLAMLLRREQVVQFTDQGYQHQSWEYDCPTESHLCTCVIPPQFEGWTSRGELWYNSAR